MSRTQQEGRNHWALVTGASAGIGEAFANEFAQNGFNLILVARRKERLEVLAGQLTDKFQIKVEVITADLSDPKVPKRLYKELHKKQIKPSVLVNNAGYAVKTGFTDTSWKVQADILQVMMTAVTELCHLFVEDMKAQHYGRIINVASVAAFTPQIPGNLYGGIKSYVACLSEALHMELSEFGINCTAVCPGFTRSEFHDVMEVKEATGKFPSFMWSSAEEVAAQGYRAVMTGKPLCIPGGLNKLVVGAIGMLPRSMLFKVGKQQALFGE
ncbi:MAG: SDR family oxidoreductase [Pseudomonadales bacterium]|nr:SDR family oxidoreductase [Pseudomonadales bacterium]